MPDDSEKKKAQPGWYVDNRWPGELRRWDGSKWLDDWRPAPPAFGERPEGFMVGGLALAVGLGVLTGIAFTADDAFGWWALWISAAVAGTVFNIGLIGKAVEIGVRAARR